MKKEIKRLAPSAKGRVLNVVIETPRGSRNKFAYDEDSGLIKLRKILPCGMSFPFDFGFLPGTLGGDGDPLDVVVLGEEPAFPGCLIEAHLLGVLEARQKEKGEKTIRNDRLLAVALLENRPLEMKTLKHVSKDQLEEIERFFVTYNEMDGRTFEPIGTGGPEAAWKLIRRSRAKSEKKSRSAKSA